MELVIYSPTDDMFVKEIKFNYEDIKNELVNRLKKYESVVYSDDQIKLAKEDRATLNKFRDAIDDKRKEIKSKVLAPYNEFEAKIKDLQALVDKPISEIDKQVKNYDSKIKQEKKNKIEEFYKSKIDKLECIVPFSALFKEQYLNATMTMRKIEEEIISSIDRIKNDLVVIDSLNIDTQIQLQVKDTYLRSFNLSEALAEKSRLEQKKLDLQKYESQNKPREVIPEQPKVVEEAKVTPAQVTEPEILVQDFRVWVTRDQLNKLKEYLVGNKIKYGRVE